MARGSPAHSGRPSVKFWKRWISDFRGKTRGCSLIEIGAYDMLLDEYYSHEAPLPTDKVSLYRICSAMDSTERAAVDRVVAKFFELGEDGKLHNTRADRYLEEEMDFIHEQRERGRIGGMRSWEKRKASGEPAIRTNGHQLDLEALPEEWRVFCATERKDLNPDSTFAKFKDHWKANANQRTGKKADWLAAWRNWVRKEPKDRHSEPDYSNVGVSKFHD